MITTCSIGLCGCMRGQSLSLVQWQSTTSAWDVGVDLSGNTADLASFSTVSHKGEGSMFGVTGQSRKSGVWLLNLRCIRKCVKHNCFRYITANLEATY